MIRQIRNKVELTAALSLIWETFLQFEAPDYSDEGVKSFRDFIENEDIVASLEFWGAYEDDELRGVIATNENRKHICCFFVKSKYHRQGIGRKLITAITRFIRLILLRMRFLFITNWALLIWIVSN